MIGVFRIGTLVRVRKRKQQKDEGYVAIPLEEISKLQMHVRVVCPKTPQS